MTVKQTLLLFFFIATMSSIDVMSSAPSNNPESTSLWTVASQARAHVDTIPPRIWNNGARAWHFVSASERRNTAIVAGVATTAALVSAYEYVRYHYDQEQWRKDNPKKAQLLKRGAVYGRGAANWSLWTAKCVLGLYVVSSALHWANGHTAPVTTALSDMVSAVKNLAHGK